MDLSTSTLFGIVAVMLVMAVLAWTLVRALPRTRGRLREETARLDVDGRRSAAALLRGQGIGGVSALAAGVLTWLAAWLGSLFWQARIDAAAWAPLEEAHTQYDADFQACVRLGSSGQDDEAAEMDRCISELAQPPLPFGDGAFPLLLGLLAPLLGALVALGLLAWSVRRRTAGGATKRVSSADLRPRGVLSFGPRWALALPALAALALMAGLVVTGVFSSRSAFGRFAVLEVERHTAGDDPAVGYVPPLTAETVVAGPFPGWFVTAPVILAVLALLAVTAQLLRVMAQAPRPADVRLVGVDDVARTVRAKMVATAAGAGLLATLGSVATSTGGAMATLAGDLRLNAEGSVEHFYHESMLSGYWIYLGGVLLGLIALSLLVRSIGAALELSSARQAAVSVALGEDPEPAEDLEKTP
jgi:hypothetical protein